MCSCVTLKSRLPISRFDSAETFGKGRAQISLAHTKAAEIIHVPNIDQDPPEVNKADITDKDRTVIGVGAGVTDSWDVEAFAGPVILRTKVQLLGKPINKASIGNFSLGLGFGLGWLNAVADDVEFDGDSNRGEMNLSISEMSLMLGWRAYQWLRIDAGGFAQTITGTGEIQTENNVDYKLSQKGSMAGWNAGLTAFINQWQIQLSYTRSLTTWDSGASDRYIDGLGLKGAYNF